MSTSYWGVDHGVEISKKQDPLDRSFKAQGIGYTDRAGRVNTRREMSRRAGLITPKSKGYRAQNWKTLGTHAGAGAAVGGAIGGAVAGAVGHKLGVKRAGRQGAAAGASMGAYYGETLGGIKNQNRARRGALQAGIKNGDIQTGLKKHEITAFGSARKK